MRSVGVHNAGVGAGGGGSRERESSSLAIAWRTRPVRFIIFFGFVLMHAIALAGAVAVSNLRESVIAGRERQLQTTAAVLAGHLEHTFEALTLTQRRFVHDVQALDIESVEAFERRMADANTHVMLKESIANLRPIHELILASARGVIVNSSRDWPASDDSISDRSYFASFHSSPDMPNHISMPLMDFATGRWVFHASHRVVSSNGAFLGLVIGVIELQYFEKLFSTLALEPGTSLSLVRRDGMILARYPAPASASPASYAANPLFKEMLPRKGRGVVRLTSQFDQKERFAAGQMLLNYPVAVTVGIGADAVLADWRKGAIEIAGVAVLLMVVLGGMVLLCAWQVGKNLARERFRLDTALNNMSHGLCMFDAANVLTVHNGRYLEIFNIPPDMVAPGLTLHELLERLTQAGILSGSQDEYAAELLASLAAGKTSQVLREIKDGRTICITNRPLPNGGWVATHEDVTARRLAEVQIAHMAHHDALTNLPNRVLLRERLEEALAHVRRGGQLAVLYLDLDHFKSINDTLGHGVGDELLKVVADRLRECVREADTVARLGGDEFAIIHAGLEQPSDAAMLASRIRDALTRPYELQGHCVPADVSIGISIAPHDGCDPDQLLKNADMALYRSKADGRGTFRFFEPAMDEQVKARRTLELDLRSAVINGEFELHYQPVVNLERGEISACEALLRWHHPSRGMVPPDEFIPVAEETGLINPIGEWVLRQACMEAATWPNDIAVAVNLSPVQVKNQNLAQLVVQALAASGLPARRLEIEITEAVLLQHNEATLATLHQLRNLGVHIAMDDFGTGYSSLSYLRSFPFDKIKIDRSFISDITEKDESGAIVQAVTSLASHLNIATTAEGVETQAQLEIVQTLGCTEMQGYLYSRPLPAREVVRLFPRPEGEAVSAA